MELKKNEELTNLNFACRKRYRYLRIKTLKKKVRLLWAFVDKHYIRLHKEIRISFLVLQKIWIETDRKIQFWVFKYKTKQPLKNEGSFCYHEEWKFRRIDRNSSAQSTALSFMVGYFDAQFGGMLRTLHLNKFWFRKLNDICSMAAEKHRIILK